MRKKFWGFILIIILVLTLAVAGFIVWAETPAEPMPEALSALQPDSQVTVTEEKWLTFTPTGDQPDTGLILYPGGRVDYRAYAPAARLIADQGYLVVIVPMPLNLAVFDPAAAADVIAAYPEIENWVVGGHSLGGAMAAKFAKSHPNDVDGLVLWASYPTADDDLSASGLRAASIFGTLDGLTTAADIDASRALLPENTAWIAIESGNHAQFGWYGNQAGDNPADISRLEQQAEVIKATVALLESF